jgi:hypothetical protein
MPTIIFRPTSDVYNTISTCVPASPDTHYDKVDEAESDGDLSYVAEQSAVPGVDYYGMSATDIPGVITNVKVCAMAKRWGSSGSVMPFLYQLGDPGSVVGTNRAIGIGDYQLFYSEFAVDPFTELPFEPDAFQDYGIGVYLSGSGTLESLCTQVWCKIEYMIPTGGGAQIIGLELL